MFLDVIINLKPKLTDTRNALRSGLVDDLHQLAVLGESFSAKRPKSNKHWTELADALDREGEPVGAPREY